MKKAFSILLIVFSAMMLIHCAYADITESLIYNEADNTWAANLNFGTGEDNSWNYGNAWYTVRPYCDWGIHFDDHGVGYDDIMEIGTNGGSWYTLSAAEWIYLLQGRPNFDQLWSFAQIYIEAENRTESAKNQSNPRFLFRKRFQFSKR